jgi:hypothetical protein
MLCEPEVVYFMLLTSTYYFSLDILLSLFQIGGQLMEQVATIAAAREEDTSEAALSSWKNKKVQKCAREKMKTAMMKMKKHQISLEESLAESGPGAGTGVKDKV